VPLAGFWEFPGGKVEAGETPQQAAQRECLEEAGIEIVVENPYPRAIHQYDHDRVELHFFACRPVDPRTKAASPFRWVEQANLGDYRFPEANAALVRHLCSRPRRGTPWDSRR
jgi:8-oxo-dGTP diphosphatase